MTYNFFQQGQVEWTKIIFLKRGWSKLYTMQEEITITRTVYFKGIRKVGLDSGMLISLVDNKTLFSEYLLKIDEEDGLLFTHAICTEEAVEVLARNYKYDREKGMQEVQKFLSEHQIYVIPRDRLNGETVRWMFRKCKEARIEFHPPDCFIIADFYKNGINKIYSNNNHFLEACQLFGMDIVKLTTTEKEIEKKLKDLFRKRHK